LKARDKNTKLFQNRASHQKRKKTVRGIGKSGGSLCKTNEGMGAMALEFLQNLYATKGSSDFDSIIDLVTPAVTEEMNHALTDNFLDKEIEIALFQMGPSKAPRPNRLPMLFYQRHWSILKAHVCRAIREILREASSLVILVRRLSS
jgi:hypothetical protein